MEAREIPAETHAQYRMSWIAYLGPIVGLLLMIAVGVALLVYDQFAATGVLLWIGIAVIVVALTIFIYRVLMIHSVVLYTDDHGVWVYSGILPWSKGVAGVKWRDLEDAIYVTGFFSWLLKSYKVRVGHRFTKTSEIVLDNIAHGNEAVEHINGLHRQALGGGPVE
ncbi:MAG: hypothetical protein ABW049_12095 [Spongiibacteraceae bacterium]